MSIIADDEVLFHCQSAFQNDVLLMYKLLKNNAIDDAFSRPYMKAILETCMIIFVSHPYIS